MEETQHDFIERVKAEILAEAERLRSSAPLPRVDPPEPEADELSATAADGIERARLDYAIGELTGRDYVDFVEQAFRAVLKRPSDDAGREQQLRLLTHGAAKAEVLGNLRWSPEGRRIGVRVRGLLPRYALAKLGRVRGVGFLVEWALALASLPLLLRHQRAADTQAAARHGAALARIDEGTGALRGEFTAALDAANQARERLERHLLTLHEERVRVDDARFEALERRSDGLAAEIAELRQHVLSMNHWTTSLQRSLDELEDVARSGREDLDAVYAAMVDAGEARTAALAAAATAFVRGLAADARVLDLGSADGAWLRALAAHGVRASGVEANAALAQRARDAGVDVATGDAFALLGRCSDAGLDGLALDGGLLEQGEALLEFVRHATRALKPGAPLLLRYDLPPRSPAPAPLAERLALGGALLRAAGFDVAETFGDAAVGGLLARRRAG